MSTLNNRNGGGWGFAAISLLFCAVVFFMSATKAASLEINLGVTANHIGAGMEMNEDNNLVTLEYKFDDSDWGVLVAKFNNSYYVDTIALGVTYDVYKTPYVELDVIVGVMKGYTEDNIGDLFCPLGADSDICWNIIPRVTVPLYTTKDLEVKVGTMLLGDALITTIGLEYSW